MCGINGIIDFTDRDSSDISEKLSQMQRATRHRGPDESGALVFPKAGVAMNRLAIQAPDLQSTVHSTRNRTRHLVFNGEIVNHLDLRNELNNSPEPSMGDTAVILPLVEQSRKSYMEKLAGMFALGIYDQEEHKVELVRDPLGIKPLYYSMNNGRLIFSSEIKGIRAAEDHSLPPELSALKNCLRYRFHPGRTSVFKNIKRVLPGETIIFENTENPKRRRYWELSSNPEKSEKERAELIEECRKVFEDIIRENTLSDVKGGFFVSGGLDSSLVTAIGLDKESRYRTPISLRFSPRPVEDERYAEMLEQHLGVDFEWVDVTDEDARKALEECVQYMDEPLENPIHIGTYLMAKRARSLGIKSVITGDGSDEFFMGYDRHQVWLGGSNNPQSDYPPHLWTLTPELAKALLSEEAKKEQGVLLGYEGRKIEPFESIEDALKLERFDRLTEYHCNRLDRMTMGNSVEARVPFLDHRMVDFSLSIPKSALYGNLPKAFLREVSRPYLPKEIVDRKKVHFPSLADEWTRGDGANWVRNILLDNQAMIAPWINVGNLKSIISDHESQKGSYGRALWAMVTLELWMRSNLSTN